MKKAKQIGFGIVMILFMVGIFCMYWLLDNWPIRYKAELNRFFGKGNWKVISDDVKYNRVHIARKSLLGDSSRERRRIGLYRDWNILCENENGEEEIWEVSNGVYMANHKRYGLLNPKRFKGKQALTLELMDLSFVVIGEAVHNEIVKEGLTEEESHCIDVEVSYHGGNPPRSFYDKLARESWFTLDGVTAENYLASDLYDFYLVIRIHGYRLEQLSEQEQENVVNNLENIEKRLLEKYGDNASFEIICDKYSVEYVDGVKQ